VAIETIKVPDIGGAEGVEVIEVCVKPGDSVSAEQSLIVLESDKASMEIPSPKAGTVVSVLIKLGDKASVGTAVIELETAATAAACSCFCPNGCAYSSCGACQCRACGCGARYWRSRGRRSY
jgi:pyruvate/2-oxoglutarate dehydrogenase complex dihydrolipoamide acyltransferase (E2) component